jgi:hypothetical protein
MPLKRTCPGCGTTEMLYANVAGFRRAKRLNSSCRSCAASPAQLMKKLAEREEMAAKNLDPNFMAGFFSKIQANLSGSMGR